MRDDSLPNHRVLGKLFGLAPCCIEFYCARTGTPFFRTHHPHLRSMGGHRFCEKCSRLPVEILIDGINARRIAPTLFPTEPQAEHLDAILNHPAWTDDERASLMAHQRYFMPKRNVDEDAAFLFYEELTAIDATYASQVAREPSRRAYFYARRELAKDESLVKLMDHLHAFMRRRIAEQQASGALTL